MQPRDEKRGGDGADHRNDHARKTVGRDDGDDRPDDDAPKAHAENADDEELAESDAVVLGVGQEESFPTAG